MTQCRVRTLATGFGFAFSVPGCSQPSPDALEERAPSAKRRKLEGTSSPADNDLRSPHGQCLSALKTTAEERETHLVPEKTLAVNETGKPTTIEVEDEPKCLPLTTKRQRGSSKRARAELRRTMEHPSFDPCPPAAERTNVTAPRPRRGAAASASAKISEGFLEEAAPIDKKRRGQEPQTRPVKKEKERRANSAAGGTEDAVGSEETQSRRRGHMHRETASGTATGDVNDADDRDDEHPDLETRSSKHDATMEQGRVPREPSRASRSAPGERNDGRPKTETGALKEASANRGVLIGGDGRGSLSDRDPRFHKDQITLGNMRFSRCHDQENVRIGHGQDHPSKDARKAEGEGPVLHFAETRKTSVARRPRDAGDQTGKRAHAAGESSATMHKKTRLSRTSAEEDVDWLFEPDKTETKKQRRPIRSSRRAQDLPGTDNDVDLDDLIANVALIVKDAEPHNISNGSSVKARGRRR